MKKDIYDLTSPQNAIWLTEKFYNNTSINNISGTLLIQDVVDFDVLKQAINIFINENPSLRLKFIVENNVPKQYLDDCKNFDFDFFNCSTQEDLKKLESTTANTPLFALDSFLFKFNLFKLSNNTGGAVIVIHHLIGDAWTTGILVDQIMNIYSSLKLDNNYFNNLPTSYLNFISSEKEYINSPRFSKDKLFWEDSFASVPEIATIPSHIDSSLDVSITCKAVRKEFTIDNKLYNSINAFCKNNKISSFNFFMAIYAIYIGRVSNLEEFTLGTPILNRSNFKEKNTTGMFISTIPFKFSINNNKSFIDFASNVGSDSLSMLKHQKYPYQDILQFIRNINPLQSNLYNMALSYQNMRNHSKDSIIPYKVNWVFPGYTADSIDIHLFDLNDKGILNIAYDYKISLYTDSDISDMHSRILHIIDTVLNAPDIVLHNIEIVTSSEKNIILNDFNNNVLDYPKNKTIIDLFEEQVILHPDNIAVRFKDSFLTYYELNCKVNQLANFLKSNYHIKQNNVVSLCMSRNIEFIISMLAVQKLGSAYLPIHPSYPKNRINYIVNDSKSVILLTDLSFKADSIPTENIKDINVDDYSNKNLNITFYSSTIAYVIYTSGSTGNPKGVAVTHRNLINFIYGYNNCFNTKFNSKDRCLCLANISFDASISELFTPFVFGACLVLYPEDTLTNIILLTETIINNNISSLFLPPNVLNDVIDYWTRSRISLPIRKLLTGIESLKKGLINKYFNLIPNIEIIIGYGPTETTICCTFFKCFLFDDPNNIIPIGKPICNNNVFILDKTLNLQPIGIPGEVYICGDNVSSGYLNNPELTKTLFVNNVKYASGICYKTGDLAFWNSDGNISFIGRNDFQIKFKGHRIELGEISNCIKNIDGVHNAVTVIKKINDIDYLCSYVVSSVDCKQIKNLITNSLPHYMVPSYIISLDTIPTTLSGKIDMKSLPDINIKEELSNVTPQTQTQVNLYNIIIDLFHIKEIDITSNLFDYGLDSLLSIKLILEISNLFNTSITVQNIFDNPSIILLASFIDSQSSTSNNLKIESIDKRDYYNISSAQKRIYLASQASSNNIYNISGGVIFDSYIDDLKLENCFKILIDRHESLRTYFEVINGDIVQKITDSVEFKLETCNSTMSEIDNIYKNFIKNFDLNKPPLFKAKLIKLNNNKCLLLVNIHHIISDGTSISIIIDELSKLYADMELEPLTITYKDFSSWEQKRLKNKDLKTSKDFWLAQFSDEIPVLSLPTTYSRPSIQSFNGDTIYSSINTYLTKDINFLCKSLDVTPYMFFLSVFYILLSKYSGQDDIIIGSPIIGRDLYELRNIVGMFVNTLALRNHVDNNINFKSFLQNVKNTCLDAYQNQSYPFDELIKDLNLKRDTSRNSLFDVMFAYQNSMKSEFNLNNINCKNYIFKNNISKFDLTLEIIPNDDILDISFEYCTDLFNNNFMINFSNHFINILNCIIKNPNVIISDIDMLSDNEKQEITNDFNQTELSYSKDKNLVDIFLNTVNSNSDNIAISIGNSNITYKELNERSDALANILIEHNINVGDVVGVCLNRSIELIISIWAILKVGAIYMPMYIGYPKDRLNYILNNSKAKLLITNEFMNSVIKPSSDYIILQDYTSIYTCKPFKYKSYDISNIAYLIYTSGSTGNPKGVQITHKCLINFVNSFNKYYNYQISDNDTFLASTNISFDVSIWELFMPILNGAKLVLYTEEIINNIVDYCGTIINNNVTALYIPPNILNEVYSLLENHSDIKINKMLVGVEPIKKETLNKYFNLNKNLMLINGYGPTETTICSTAIVYKKDMADNSVVPIGKPLGNTHCYIVDKNMNIQPIGIIGELYITGDGVGKGYINNIDETNKNYLNNIFDSTSDKMYKTGDLVKWNSDGTISYVGRCDNQVKISGYRIELKEIEYAIMQYPHITKALTTTYQSNNSTILISYFTAEQNINITDLITYLQSKLTFYMIPKSIMQLDSFPLTPNGKVSFKELPKPILRSNSIYVAPETVLQEQLCGVFRELFNIEKIGIDDNFFDLGGDSLVAIKLQAELLNLGLNITYNNIFSYPTIRELSEISNIVTCNDILDIDKNYDFSAINNLLAINCEENISKSKIKQNTIGNVLLIGATGFLGAHILDNLLTKSNSNVYCIIRRKSLEEPIDRLKKVLNFYFDDKYNDYFNKRIFVIAGDITDYNLNMNITDYNNLADNVSIVINSAALVKHFGNYDTFNDINVLGLKNIIDFCKKYNKKLYHISTTSVSGIGNLSDDIKFEDKIHFTEHDLYIQQNLNNVYIYTKFKAEQLIYEEILNGLSACVLRVGNITNRYSDGKFQINLSENAFVNKLKAIIELR